MTHEMESRTNIPELEIDLAYFGLNPYEWTIVRKHSEQFEIVSKLDKDFRFRGKAEATEDGISKWEFLSLQSL